MAAPLLHVDVKGSSPLGPVRPGCSQRIFTKVMQFGAVGDEVPPLILKRTFDVPLEKCTRLLYDHPRFLAVMMDRDIGEFHWLPNEDRVITYFHKHDGFVANVKEKVFGPRVERDGSCVLEWENVGSDPPLPLKDYKSHWKCSRMIGASGRECTELTWTRTLRQVYVFGCMSIGGRISEGLRKSANLVFWNLEAFYACQFPLRLPVHPDSQKKDDKNPSFVIIGAGPSGLHMAFQLKKRGYENVKILEKSNRIGGKSLTIPYDTRLPNNRLPVNHELGTCYMSPAYFAVRSLLREVQEIFEKRKGSQTRKVYDEVAPDVYTVTKDGHFGTTLDEWLQEEVRGSLQAQLLKAVKAYNKLHRQIFGSYNYTMPPPPAVEHKDMLDMSFLQFLQLHKLDVLVKLLGYAHTAQGYGTLEDTPAFWGLSWITPELLNGYLAAQVCFLCPGKVPPKKAMLVNGWELLWHEIMEILGAEKVVLEADVENISRADNGCVTVKYRHGGTLHTERFDYLVVAAPIHLEGPQVLRLTETEQDLFCAGDIDHSQFRTNLYKMKYSQPYLSTHLTIYPDLIIGPRAGTGEVFAFRDSYLARWPDLNSGSGEPFKEDFKKDPVRELWREQMCYQFASPPMESSMLEVKFRTWMQGQFGKDGYEVVPTVSEWNYFYHYSRAGLRRQKPWRLLAIQGQHNTIWAHASNYFESVLDIVNYQNMVMDSLQGKTQQFSNLPPETCKKPERHQDHIFGSWVRFASFFLFVPLLLCNILWTLWWCLLWPFNEFVVFRFQRWLLQVLFRTKNHGYNFFSYSMKKFIDISPSAVCLRPGAPEDAIVKKIFDEVVQTPGDFDWMKRPHSALQWNYSDYRTLIREWIRVVDPKLFGMIPECMKNVGRWCYQFLPMTYGIIITLIAALQFSCITGYGYASLDEQGVNYYIPECKMLKQARKDYPEPQAERICSHLCKIFSEETMKKAGLTLTFEPDMAAGSCVLRGKDPRSTCCCDNELLEW